MLAKNGLIGNTALMDLEKLQQFQLDFPNHKCAWCKASVFQSENILRTFVGQEPGQPPQVLPFLMVICQNCGLQYMFNALYGKLLPANAQAEVNVQVTNPVQNSNISAEEIIKNLDDGVQKELSGLYALETRAGVLMGVVATVIALQLNIPQQSSAIGYLNVSLLAPLLPLIISFGFYMFTFLPSWTVKSFIEVKHNNTGPGQPSVVVAPTVQAFQDNLDKFRRKKSKRIRWGHSLFAGGLFGLVIAQIFLKYAQSATIKYTKFEFLLEFLLLVSIETVVVALVKQQFKPPL